MHCSALCAAHTAPVAATPPVHVHCFSAHWRSLVALAALDANWCSLHTACDAHVPGVVGVGATAMYSLASHAFTSLHVREPLPTTPHMKPGFVPSDCHEWPSDGTLHIASLPCPSAAYEHSPAQRPTMAPKPRGMSSLFKRCGNDEMYSLCPRYSALRSALHHLGWSHTGCMPTLPHRAIIMALYDPDADVARILKNEYDRAGTPFMAPSEAVNDPAGTLG